LRADDRRRFNRVNRWSRFVHGINVSFREGGRNRKTRSVHGGDAEDA
jgi:hypothetical protein